MSVPRITPRALRALAEAALGGRERPQGIVVDDPDDPNHLAVIPRAALTSGVTAPSDGHTYVIELDQVRPNLKNNPLEVLLPGCTMDGEAIPKGDVAPIADALFWSAAAVDKFLLPYYASFVDLDVLQKHVVEAFQDPGVLAIVHLPDSETVIIDDVSIAPSLGKLVRDSGGGISVVKLF